VNFHNFLRRNSVFPFASVFLIAAVCALPPAVYGSGADWESSISKNPPGHFPTPKSVHAVYRFGWSGLTAAAAQMEFTKDSDHRFQLKGTGGTIGLARLLWTFDVDYCSVANADTLRPIEVRQTETYHSKKLFTHLVFNNAGVKRKRTEWPKDTKNKTREFDFPNLFDLHSALLYLRSQPLTNGSVYRIVVYPATNAYLVTLTVLGRGKISVRAGTYPAIKLDLQLERIGKHMKLEPHRKFYRATIWISDDANRLPLRAEVQIFIGTVFGELQSARLVPDKAKPASPADSAHHGQP
jgi:hypothetical protein